MTLDERFTWAMFYATRALGSREKADEWLSTVNKALGGVAPVFMLSTEEGYFKVVDVLARIEHGMAS